MAKKSQLHSYHREHGKMMEFGGFDMPVWYTGIIQEHCAVRNAAGLFDVSHMGRFSIRGRDATSFLDLVLPTAVSKMKDKRAFYSTICNQGGGIMDDVITNKFSETDYTMVVNAANREKDLRWLEKHSESYSVEIDDDSDRSALIAFQGPLSPALLQKTSNIDLNLIRRFAIGVCQLEGYGCVVSRTGYTGEDGFEINVKDCPVDEPEKASRIWNRLLEIGKDKGVQACGLGARDTLRLEAGMCLYGNDIDERTSPIEASLDSLVSRDKTVDYIGRHELEKQSTEGTSRRRIGFSMVSGGIPRHGQEIRMAGSKVGVVTSGSFSPTVKNGIGMGYVPTPLSSRGQTISIEIRNEAQPASVVATPFYDIDKFGYKRLPQA